VDDIDYQNGSSLIEVYFNASGEEDWSPRYNFAPTQPVSAEAVRAVLPLWILN
jgi:hypothetical protein